MSWFSTAAGSGRLSRTGAAQDAGHRRLRTVKFIETVSAGIPARVSLPGHIRSSGRHSERFFIVVVEGGAPVRHFLPIDAEG